MARQRKPVTVRRSAEVSSSDPPKPLAFSRQVVELAKVRRARRGAPARSPFDPAEPYPRVVPEGDDGVGLAQDEALSNVTAWATGQYAADTFAEGMVFLGYSYLSVLAQRPEYRVVSEEIASEMTREWVEIKSVGEDDKSERVRAVEDGLEELGVRELFCKAIEHDGFFGRGQLYLDTGDTEDKDALKTSIGDGRDATSRAKVSRERPLKAIRTVEPVWSYPANYNSTDPLAPDWYDPLSWYVMGKEVHRTRLLTMVGREVPDMLKPAYAFGGLSMSQMLKPYVDNWLRTRQSTSDLVHSFSVSGLKTDLATYGQASGDALFQRIDLFNAMRDNSGTMILNKDTEDWFNVQTSLATLDQLQAQSQEHMAAIARIPLVKLLGISPHGLNASSEGELRAFYDWIAAFQHKLLMKPLATVIGFIQLSRFGDVDPGIVAEFKPLWQLDEAAKANVEKTKADTHAVYVDLGAVSPEEVRGSVAKDKDSAYAGLDLEDSPAPGPPGGGEMGPGAPEDVEEDSAAALGRWRAQARELFGPDDLHYWSTRASRTFGPEEGARWAEVARRLFHDDKDEALIDEHPDPDHWLAQLVALRSARDYEDPPWRERAAAIPRNTTTLPEPTTWRDRVARAFPGDLEPPSDDFVTRQSAKRAQDEVSYEFPATGDDRCADCVHFQPFGRPKRCALVDGLIEPGAWCELFEAHVGQAEDAAKWDEDKHPRGQPGNAGQFGPGGGSKKKSDVLAPKDNKRDAAAARTRSKEALSPEKQRANVKGITAFLGIVSGAQERSHLPEGMTAPAKVMLTHGRQFIFDSLSYAGKRGKAHGCYMNAGRIALDDSSKTYVEGYVSVHGVPIEHAWVVDADGKVQDPTITGPEGILGYFGLPIKTEYLRDTILKKGTWGVLDFTNRDIYKTSPREYVRSGIGERVDETAESSATAEVGSASRLLEIYSKNVTVEALMATQPKEVGVAVRAAEQKLAQSVPTDALVSQGGFKNEDGTYTDERQELHLAIVSKILTPEAVSRATPARGEAPTFTMIGGRAGSGKSYFTEKKIVGDDVLVLDNDSIKAMLPEYRGYNAGLVHEEASAIFDRVDGMARELGINIAHDCTMKTYISAQRRVDAYKEKGYKFKALYMFAPPQEAAQRAIGRFMQKPPQGAPEGSTGRYVPPSYVLGSTTNEASFDALKENADSWAIYKSYDTKEPFKPEIVAESRRER